MYQNQCENSSFPNISQQCCQSKQLKLDVLTFQQLETLTNLLMNETLEMETDFFQKLEFANEQQQKVEQNENELNDFTRNLKYLQFQMSAMDQELCEISTILSTYSEKIMCLEELQKMKEFCSSSNRKCRTGCKSDWELLKDLFIETDSGILINNNLSNQIMELLKRAEMQPSNPYNVIFNILNYHYESLNNTDKNLDLLQDKLINIQEMQEMINCKFRSK